MTSFLARGLGSLLGSLLGGLLAAGLSLATSLPAHAAAAYSEHWNGPPSTQGWLPSTAQTQLAGDADNGLPPGSLAAVLIPDGSADPAIGVHSGLNTELEGDFSGQTWTVSFDVRRVAGDAQSFALRYHMYDFPHIWYRPLPVPDLDTWTHMVVQFDADWTDDEAFAAGWLRDGLAYTDFSTFMSYVTGTELHMEFADSAHTALINIDNFVQTSGGSVPVPATAALALLGLGAISRRTRARPSALRPKALAPSAREIVGRFVRKERSPFRWPDRRG